MAKAVVPRVVGEVIDRAMQVHGAEGICQDQPLAALWAGIRTLRFADGPDEVHIQQSESLSPASAFLSNPKPNDGFSLTLEPISNSRSQGAQARPRALAGQGPQGRA